MSGAYSGSREGAGLAGLSDEELLARCRELPAGSGERTVIREVLVRRYSRWCAVASAGTGRAPSRRRT